MKYISLFSTIIVATFLISCNDNVNSSEPVLKSLFKNTTNFNAHLSGDEEVPPVNTQAQGQAIFQLSKDGSFLSYKLIAANIENITQAHIHLAPVGVNGGVVAWLYPSAPPAQLIPGRFSGVLAEGTITSDDLVGELAGMSLGDLITEMTDGNTYVNIHTSQYPSGEVRGQID